MLPGLTRYFALMLRRQVAITIIVPRLFIVPRGNVSLRLGSVSEAGLSGINAGSLVPHYAYQSKITLLVAILVSIGKSNVATSKKSLDNLHGQP